MIFILFSFCKHLQLTSEDLQLSSQLTDLLLHPVEDLPPLLPQPVDGALGVDVPLPRYLQPGQMGVLLTDCAAEGLLSKQLDNVRRDTW